jgi:hypothetical protein
MKISSRPRYAKVLTYPMAVKMVLAAPAKAKF